jgi:hypothetical protein
VAEDANSKDKPSFSYLLGKHSQALPEDALRTWTEQQLRQMNEKFCRAMNKQKIEQQKTQ